MTDFIDMCSRIQRAIDEYGRPYDILGSSARLGYGLKRNLNKVVNFPMNGGVNKHRFVLSLLF